MKNLFTALTFLFSLSSFADVICSTDLDQQKPVFTAKVSDFNQKSTMIVNDQNEVLPTRHFDCLKMDSPSSGISFLTYSCDNIDDDKKGGALLMINKVNLTGHYVEVTTEISQTQSALVCKFI